MRQNQLFSSRQFGFISGRSTTLQLLHVLEEWTKALDEGEEIDVIYTEFQKAFDSVPYQRLLSKLRSYGITDQVLGRIKSFLLNRKQRVAVNGIVSKWKYVISGVPQGNVLGPILFVIFINDIMDGLATTSYFFADDMKIFKRICNVADQATLQQDLDKISDWTKI